MKTKLQLLVFAVLLAAAFVTKAEKTQGANGPQRNLKQATAGCTPSAAFAWLDVNNVRVRINAGGDMWWDLPGGSGSKYFVPANGSATSLYTGSLWIAGVDINNQLKCAAVRFRQMGNDFWTGPLTTDGTASIDEQTCSYYDRIFTITRAEVDDFIKNSDPATGMPNAGYTIPENIVNWPAHSVTSGASHYLAPFYDNDGDGEYNPSQGDYPYYDVDNVLCHSQIPTMEEERAGTVNGSILVDQVIKGDKTLWWVFNDKGNVHTESGGEAIGLEIRAQAFAFATEDEVNDMTFYGYEIINRSSNTLMNTYFSPWTDVDLGYAKDDYIGCDVSRGLGYGYNATPIDGSGQPEAYGSNPPAVGIDFFQGPYMDPDGIDNPKYDFQGNQLCDESINGVNFGNDIVDDERYGMRRFVYTDNSGSAVNGDPDDAEDYYNLLQGIWRNGQKMQYGGMAVPGGAGTVGPECDFMFPYDSDPCNWGTGGVVPNGGFNQNGFYWSEETGNNGNPNPSGDRRFIQSAGPFTMQPGSVNYITFGVPWARATTGTAWASVELLKIVDDKCQAMFDNCFKIIDGPDAPDLTIRELDRQLIVYISNSETSNNNDESYIEQDPYIVGSLPTDSTQQKDPYYRFEGYKVYQLANENVTADELGDDTKARLVFQCDVENNIGKIINYIHNDYLHANVPTLMVEGLDNGIKHSFSINVDNFSHNNDYRLVNGETYYFMAVAYAYNNFMTYSTDPSVQYGLFGQKRPYLEGKKNIKIYSAVPHVIENGSTAVGSYGEQLQVTRWVGIGNGGNELEMSDEDVENLLAKQPAKPNENIFGMETYPVIYHPTYKKGHGPVDVHIVDPLNVVTTDYSLSFVDFQDITMYNVTGDESISGDSAVKRAFGWVLRDLNSGETFHSNSTTERINEQLFLERGIAVNILQSWDFGPIKVGYTGTGSDGVKAYAILSPDNGKVSSSVTYADESNCWLGGIRDCDLFAGNALNWIRSGIYKDGDNPENNDYLMRSGAYDKNSRPYDPNENYENIAGGSWAPYMLASMNKDAFNFGPVYPKDYCKVDSIFHKMGSIDIVLTSDKSKWTRCPVVEMCLDENFSEGNAKRFALRNHVSVDKNGNYAASMDMQPSENPDEPNYISAYGMGWFPGYAIDIETGARLNLIFGEDSRYPEFNGNDMLFNPPALKESTVLNDASQQLYDPVLFNKEDGTPIFGAKHFVYVFPMIDKREHGGNNVIHDIGCPAYDAGRTLHEAIHWMDSVNKEEFRIVFWGMPTWVGMPMAIEGKPWLPENNPVKVSVRVNVPYRPGYGTMALETNIYDENIHSDLNPYYKFSTVGMDTKKFLLTYSSDALGSVSVICEGSPLASGSEVVAYSTITATATPIDGVQRFYGWTNGEGGEHLSTDNPYSFNIKGDTHLYANFVPYGIDETNYVKLTAYPNPVKVGQPIVLDKECDKIQIFNSLGMKIAEYTNTNRIEQINVSGVYLMKAHIGKSVGCVKVLVE